MYLTQLHDFSPSWVEGSTDIKCGFFGHLASLTVEILSPDVYNIFCMTISLLYQQGDEVKSLRQFHFMKWPDHGVPQYATPLLNFLRLVRDYFAPETGPTVIHCR